MKAAIERLNFYREPGGKIDATASVANSTLHGRLERAVAIKALAELAAALHLGEDEIRAVVRHAETQPWKKGKD